MTASLDVQKLKALVVNEDGEAIHIGKVTVQGPRHKYREDYMSFFLSGFEALAVMMCKPPAGAPAAGPLLTSEALKVLFFCLSRLNTQNEVAIRQNKEIAEALGVQAGAVSRALKTLCELKILIKEDDGKLTLSPSFGWRGKVSEHKQAAARVIALIKSRASAPPSPKTVAAWSKRAKDASIPAGFPDGVPVVRPMSEIDEYSLLHGTWLGAWKMLRWLLEEVGEDPNERAQDGTTPLMIASGWGSAEEVLLLLEHGAKPTSSDCEDDTALHHCAAFSRDPVVGQALIDEGCPVNAINSSGQTALHRACEPGDFEPVNVEMVEMLLENGADRTIADARGRLPKDYLNPRWPEQAGLAELL